VLVQGAGASARIADEALNRGPLTRRRGLR
jgi:hypothetical protein